jgi:two-component system, OmpR family, sensor histidine kinase MtrB
VSLRSGSGRPGRSLRRSPGGWLRAAARTWRRSLRLRVVALTLLLSSAVVVVLGLILVDRIGHGLLADKRRAALADVSSGLSYARDQLTSAASSDPASVNQLVETIAIELGRRGSPSGLFDVAILPTSGGLDAYATPIETHDIPEALRVEVRGGAEAETYANIHRSDRSEQRSLVIGAPLSAAVGGYEVYYVFPLRAEEQTLALVQRVLLLGGAGLVGLLAAVAWLVSRQVVRPVRMAARIAERFAAGHLEERMQVHGDDEIARLAASFNDMAGALQRQIDQLEELSRIQRRFTADVSHELRTPLATIRMAADVLYESRADFPPAMARSAEIMTGQLERFERLLVDLLEISRHDAGVVELELETVDVAALVRRIVADFEPSAVRAGTRIEVDLGPGGARSAVPLPPVGDRADAVFADIDARRVNRILRNLLANALDHAEGAPIEVTLAASEDTIGIRVRDHGVGLRPDDRERVFDRFWRADPSRSRTSGGGTGLGLAIAREDARLHGGELVAWGREGQGATFRLLLPRHPGTPLGTVPLSLTTGASLARSR